MFAEVGSDMNIQLFATDSQYVFPANEETTPIGVANAILVRLGCILERKSSLDMDSLNPESVVFLLYALYTVCNVCGVCSVVGLD